MQVLTYIEEIAAEGPHNKIALIGRKKYFENIKNCVSDYIKEQKSIFKNNILNLVKTEKPTFDQIFESIMNIK